MKPDMKVSLERRETDRRRDKHEWHGSREKGPHYRITLRAHRAPVRAEPSSGRPAGAFCDTAGGQRHACRGYARTRRRQDKGGGGERTKERRKRKERERAVRAAPHRCYLLSSGLGDQNAPATPGTSVVIQGATPVAQLLSCLVSSTVLAALLFPHALLPFAFCPQRADLFPSTATPSLPTKAPSCRCSCKPHCDGWLSFSPYFWILLV